MWCHDSKRLGIDSDEQVQEYINRYVTCRLPDKVKEPLLHKLVTDYQSHRCNNYCLRVLSRKGRRFKKCRFGFPRSARATLQLNDALTSISQRMKGKFESRLYEIPRSYDESCINDYNPIVLLLWGANMDLQYIGESSNAIENYVCGYITKRDESASNMWQDIDKSKSLCKELYQYAFMKMNNRECGAIEAIDRLLGQPLYQKTRQTIYINARLPCKRNAYLKPLTKLKYLIEENADSIDKYEANWIDNYYIDRPEVLEHISMFDLRRFYDKIPKPQDPKLKFRSSDAGLKRRREAYLVSHPMFKSSDQVEEYQYSLLLMFKPFRNEGKELIDDETGSCKSIFEEELCHNQSLREYHEKLQGLTRSYLVSQFNVKTTKCNTRIFTTIH